jgi:PAS domain S-box-containing protein
VDGNEYYARANSRATLAALVAGVTLLAPLVIVALGNRIKGRRQDERLSALRERLDDQAREQARLLVKNAQMSAAARMAAIGYWVTKLTDSGWVLTAATPEIAEMYGVPQRRLVGSLEYSRGHVHPDDRERVYAIWDDADLRPRRYEVEFRIQKPGGATCHVLEVGEPVFDRKGALTHYRGTMQDITDYRQHGSGKRQGAVVAAADGCEYLPLGCP